MTRRSASLPLLLEDGKPIDHATEPPRGCAGDLVTVRPCPHTACRYHLWAEDERPGRPHHIGARPPTKLLDGVHAVHTSSRPSCTFDEVKASPDGMTSDDLGLTLEIVGERVRQVEFRGALKWEATFIVMKHMEAARLEMAGKGMTLDHVHAHNLHETPGDYMVSARVSNADGEGAIVTAAGTVDAKKDKRQRPAFSGVMVRRRRK